MKDFMYAIRQTDGAVISIFDVPLEEKGTKCNCICPQCGRAFEACSLNGKVRRYFRHHSETHLSSEHVRVDCEAWTANETALHKMAKEVLAEEKKVSVPAMEITYNECGGKHVPIEVVSRVPIYRYSDSQLISSINVEIEKRVEDMRPDVIFHTSAGDIFIEIYVNHKKSQNDIQKAQSLGANVMEIDLSRYLDDDQCISRKELKRLLYDNNEIKKWLTYPQNALSAAKQYYENSEPIKQYLQENKARIEKEEAEALAKLRREAKLLDLFETTNYANELYRLRNDNAFIREYRRQHKPHYYDFAEHFQKEGEVPFFIDIPIKGEMLFQCDRRVWQAIIFNRYIFGRKTDGGTFNIKSIFDNLRNDHSIPIDYDLMYGYDDPTNPHQSMHLPSSVVSTYVKFLQDLGFVEETQPYEYNWKKVLARKTISCPNTSAAKTLSNAIKNLGPEAHLPETSDYLEEQMSFEREMRYSKKRKERQERERIELEEKEAKRKEVLEQRHREEEARKEQIRNEVKNFDYNRKDASITDENGYRMAVCVCCGEIVKANRIKEWDYVTLNRGVCISCYRQGKRMPK